MIHKTRTYRVADRVRGELYSTPKELAHVLFDHSWCMCNGFRLEHLVFLNDAFSADGAQEYAVFDERTGRQIESLTVSWFDNADKLTETITKLLAGDWPDVSTGGPMPSFKHPDGPCHHCA